MANPIGYSLTQTDRPGVWYVDGYVNVALSGAPSYTSVQSGIVKSIVRNSTGNYSITLAECWFALLDVNVKSIIDPSLSPATVGCQINSSNVGSSAASTNGSQKITFTFNVAGTATDLPAGSGFFFRIELKQSSA